MWRGPTLVKKQKHTRRARPRSQMLGVARATGSQIIAQGLITIFYSSIIFFLNNFFVLLEQLKKIFQVE